MSAVELLLYLASSLDRFSVLKYFFVLNLAYGFRFKIGRLIFSVFLLSLVPCMSALR